jgi:LacI family transcriptional regulator
MREEDAGRLGAMHLLDFGHMRLGLLAGPRDLDTARRRMKGFVDEAGERGADVRVVHAPYDEAGARIAMRELLTLEPRPTAIFMSNLNQAIGAVAAVRDLDVAVPGDVSLIACDEDPIVAFLGVPLTTIRMPLAQLGAAAVDALLEQIAGGAVRDVTIPDPPVVIERASCAAPARAA